MFFLRAVPAESRIPLENPHRDRMGNSHSVGGDRLEARVVPRRGNHSPLAS